MMRRTVTTLAVGWRFADNLKVDRDGKNMSSYMKPYRAWEWKQNELYRNILEAQWDHLRKVYRRQWYEAFRVNSDEYIHKYNQTKAAQIASWEAEMEDQDKKRREALHMAEGRKKLRDKHRDILREYHERHFFHWYERASERLQYLAKTPFVKKEDIDAHIEAELNKYVAGKEGSYPLNFTGQMPFLEDEDGNIVQVPETMATNYEAHYPESEATRYQPPSSLHARTEAFNVSAAIVDIDGEDLTAEALEDMTRQKETAIDDDENIAAGEASDEDVEVSRMKYVSRGKLGGRARHFKKGGARPAISPTGAAEMPTKASPATSTTTNIGDNKQKRKTGKKAPPKMIPLQEASGAVPATETDIISADEAIAGARKAAEDASDIEPAMYEGLERMKAEAAEKLREKQQAEKMERKKEKTKKKHHQH